MNVEIIPMEPDSDGAKLAELFANDKEYVSKLLKQNEELITENQKLREGLSLVASNIGNGSGASPRASIEFLTIDVPAEVKLACANYRREISFLKAKNRK